MKVENDHRSRAELPRQGHPPRRRQALRQGLRPDTEDLFAASHPVADAADQLEEGHRRRSGLRADLLGRGARHRRREDARHPRERRIIDEAACRAWRRASAARPRTAWGTFRPSSPPGGRWISASVRPGREMHHSRHLYGEYWHRAFTVSADTPYGIQHRPRRQRRGDRRRMRRRAPRRRARARHEARLRRAAPGRHRRRLRRMDPIKPKTDGAFMFALIHVMLHERRREDLDLPFLRDRAASPYLVGPNGCSCASRPAASRCCGTPPAMPPCLSTRRTPCPLEGRFTVPEAYRRGPTRIAGSIATSPRNRPSRNWWPTCSPIRRSGPRRFARCRPNASAASPTSSSTTPASARPSRSTARCCPSAPSR